MKRFIYHIEHTYGDDQNVWTTAEDEYEAEQNIRHDYHSIKSLTLRKVEDMYLENGDEVIEADNGKLILANSGAYCDENGNPTGGCIDYEDTDVYVTKTGSVYHTSKDCPSLKARNPEVKKISLSEDRWKLRCLEMAGVDNWTWYDQAMSDYEADEYTNDELTKDYNEAN